MKKLSAAIILASLLVLVPFQSQAAWYDPESLARWAGCRADVQVEPTRSVLGSHYHPGYAILHIGTATDVPLAHRIIITFHEIGHCLQDQAGHLNYGGPFANLVEVELDADRQAADLACRYGLDGRRMLHDIFVWAKQTFGYTGDDAHGTVEQRISQGDLAEACQPVLAQSP